jgi:pentose-5-phosphate-3-epimerase
LGSGEEVSNVIAAGADAIQFDMMGSHCVPGLTIGPLVCEARHPCATVPIDAHLMVGPVDRIIADFASAGGEYHDFRSGGREHAERIAHKKPHPVSPTVAAVPCPAAAARPGRWTVPPAMR